MRNLKLSALMRNRLFKIGAGLAALTAVFLSSAAAQPAITTLHGHVPAAVSRLQPKGLLPATNRLYLAIGLPLRNREVLTNLLQQIYDPASPNYHHYLTPEQFTAQFGPTEQDYNKVIDFAKANGLTVVNSHPNRMLLDVSGKAADIGKTFQVTLRTYHHPTENRDFFAPDTEPTVDSALPILHISGLDNYSLPHPNFKIRPLNQASGVMPALGSAPGGNYQGSDFRNAYVPGTSLTGSGQNVGLLQFDGFYPGDIAAYENQIGLTNNLPQLVVVSIDGGVPVPTPFGNPEVSLDIEMVLSMSPGVSKIYVYEAPNPSPWVDLLSRMANDNVAKQLSCSWGGGPPDPAAEQIFQQMALQGQTFFNASGDGDAFTGAISFPADSPHITEVGGTTLTTGSSASYTSETVWNWGVEFGPSNDGIGSSGGISTFYSIPSWQTNINFTASHASRTMRNVPDVSLTADHVWVIYGAGSSGWFGGTSCAAPLWAGFTALVNQLAASNGHAPVGFINPAVYAIATGPNYTSCFHDTTTGNNTWSGSPNQFFAVANYDLCTGLGTPNGTNLINALAASVNPVIHLSPPTPPYGSTLAVLNGANPNGTWDLFELDDGVFDSGVITNGWILALTTANPVGAAADNLISMTATMGTVPIGSNGVYTLTVTNYGPSASSNVLVSETLPFGVTFISATNTLGSVSRGGATLTWNIGTLTNAGAQLTVTVQPNSAGPFTSFAIVSASTPDPNPSDDFASATINAGTIAPAQLTNTVVNINGTFQLTVNGQSGQEYIVQASTNLINWVPVYTNPSPFVSPFTFTDPNASSYLDRFYRVVTGP
jgi:uncharacterized repeat protein (TIGR01451 family)